jgi:hypothetical protein
VVTWDERYSQPGFAYGSEPNEFLAAGGRIPVGTVLSLGRGDGRNAAYLAGLGHRVVGGSELGDFSPHLVPQLFHGRGVAIQRIQALSRTELCFQQ